MINLLRVFALIGLLVGTLGCISLACVIGSGRGSIATALEMLFNMAMVAAALWILNQPEGTFTPRC